MAGHVHTFTCKRRCFHLSKKFTALQRTVYIIGLFSKTKKEGSTVVKLLQTFSFLGAFAKFRKATIIFVMSVSPSARMEQLGFHWTDLFEI
jgi:hypothetical protein